MRSQSEASLTRKALEERLQRVKVEAEMQKEKVAESASAEMQALTDQIREHLDMKEHELEELKKAQEDKSGSQKTKIRELKHAIQLCTSKYNDLQEQRKSDMERVETEVKQLRELVTTAENRSVNNIPEMRPNTSNVDGRGMLLELDQRLLNHLSVKGRR